MKKFYLLSAVSIILQSQTRIICWPILVVGASARQFNERKLYILAFFLGILTDLISGRMLGITSAFLTFFVFSLLLLKLRFKDSYKVILGASVVFELIYLVLVNSALI